MMKFLVYTTLTDENVTTLAGLFSYVAQEVPFGLFIPFFLLSLCTITTLSIIYGQKRTGGDSNFFGALAVGSYLTFVVSLVMTLIPNLIQLSVVLITLAVSILSTFLYLISKDKSSGF